MQHLPSEIFDVTNTYTSVRSLKNTCTMYFELLKTLPFDVKIRVNKDETPNSHAEFVMVLRRHSSCLLHVDLSRSTITDVSALGGVHALYLRRTKVTDVSALGGMYTLNLR